MFGRKDKETEEIREEEKVKIRHTINAEETFTLAKDVFDIRCFIKNVYSNRAVIARRLNVLSLSVSAVFTLLYAAFLIFGGFFNKLNLGWEITWYVLLGVYVALFLAIFIVLLCSRGAKTKSVRKISRVLAYFRLAIRLMSLAISIAALALTASGGDNVASNLAVDVLIIIFSIIVLILQVIPLIFGGAGKLVRWLLSPVKIKYRFSTVVLEWYELAATGSPTHDGVKKVSKKYIEDIGRVIDNILMPALGKKYINAIKPVTLLNVVAQTAEEDRQFVEGVLTSLFAYAAECGYVTFNPCNDLSFEGSVEEEIKKKKTVKDRLFGIGKKIGKSMLDKYITSATDEQEDS